MGASAYNQIEHWIDQIPHTTAIEIGASGIGSRENSTQWFIDYFANSAFNFVSVDTDQTIIDSVASYVASAGLDNIIAHCGDYTSLDVNDISFAYLDNYDYPPPGNERDRWFIDLCIEYTLRGKELTLENSAQAHLEQAKWVHTRSADQCVIIFDDTFDVTECTAYATALKRNKYPKTGMYGKGMTAVPWLLHNGWQILPKAITPRDDWVIVGKGLTQT